ncbi:hypothetical protein BV98_001526 [Sphingobium herbicidovorans NBRC 16415]|uniref:Uncharacterized protein n=1 Tax=Sphingobium herbicidovorans (strain ATCC 700291 / DSM 11019 / CCUG 56400 / KCTC 2939 / LMG 18315 / NBRC 16415 / MH) TaxID=1219045 RepID=A0A086PAA6_SPHHM|nr:hypothetical protein [Sphingobium herbicidovorans]KFG90324.1 hypothetical protein BV98_001526 [Sphingobium herbicidovorans NBRC 16415]
MLANLRHDMLREIGKVSLYIVEASVAPERIAQNPGDKSIDQRIALLCRHEVLHRDHAMLAIDDRQIEQAIEIGGKIQPVIDIEEDLTFAIDMRKDLGPRREAADRIPEFRRAAPRLVQVIEQQVRDLMRCNEGAPVPVGRSPFGESTPVDPALSLRAELGFTRG